jgi:glucose uptake protein GlcU
VSLFLLQLSSHNQRAALMPMMVGMMVCAVVVAFAAEDHNVDTHVKFSYT